MDNPQKCPKCGEELKSHWTICPNCSTQILKAKDTTSEPNVNTLVPVKKIKTHPLVYIAVLFLIILFVLYDASSSNTTHQAQTSVSQQLTPEQQAIQERYDNAIKSLNENKPQDALDILVGKNLGDGHSITKYKDGEVLFNYGLAMREFNNKPPGKRGMVDYYLEKIPDNYSGDLAEEIRNYKAEHMNDNQRYYKEHPLSPEEEKRRDEELDKVLAETEKVLHPLVVGDPSSKVIQYYGKPKEIHKTGTQYGGVTEQWIYNGLYIYIENGRVSGWQN